MGGTLPPASLLRRHSLARLDLVSFLIGLVLLPFFVWSWIKHDADEDAAAALSIAAWMVIGVSAMAAIWYAFG